MSENKIYSSTGELGVSRRQFNRLYANGTRFSDNPDEVIHNFRRLADLTERHPRMSRGVFRGMVSAEVLDMVLQTELQRNLEVAVPMNEFTGDDSCLVYMSHNSAGRDSLVPVEDMIRETSYENGSMRNPLERVLRLQEQGCRFIDQIQGHHVQQLAVLWGPTFGWDEQQVANLARRIEQEDPENRSVWLSAIEHQGQIISASMAERLQIPGRNESVDIVESTEWFTQEQCRGNGLMTSSIVMLNAQILRDSKRLPFIYAECNFTSRSDRAGHSAGLRVPFRDFAPQILVQNVGVRENGEATGLRDFTFMYVPVDVIQNHYDPVTVHQMLQHVAH